MAAGTAILEQPVVESGDLVETLPQRVFGKIEEDVPILGLGTAPGGMGLKDEDAIALYHRAIDVGVTYIDTAPDYQRGQVQVGQVMKDRRDEVFLVTKTNTDNAEKALAILDNSLKELQTECADLTFVHAMGSKDVENVLSPSGALAGLREAQRRGWTRFVGFTAHNLSAKSVKMLQEAEVDAVMLAMNFVDRFTYGFEDLALPLAIEQNVGVAAMKVFGGAPKMAYDKPTHSKLAESGPFDHETAMRYALGLPGVSVAVIGMYNEAELMQNVQWAKNYSPLTSEELERLADTGRSVAEKWGTHFGAAE